MKRLEHTPGNWEALRPKKSGGPWSVGAIGTLGGTGAIARAKVSWKVAQIHNGAPGDTLETEAANARLIAAAPRMYAELWRQWEEASESLRMGFLESEREHDRRIRLERLLAEIAEGGDAQA